MTWKWETSTNDSMDGEDFSDEDYLREKGGD